MAGLIWAAYAVAFIPAMAVLNRARGGGFGADRLPGHPRFYVAPAVGGLLWPLYGPWWALAAAAGYLAWAWLPWGRWFDLGRLPEGYVERKPNAFERAVDRMCPDDHSAFTYRNTIGLILASALIHPIMVLLAPLQTAAYEVGWRLRPQAPIELAELLTGILWGLFLLAALALASG